MTAHDQFVDTFVKSLNTHGYAFQQAVIAEAKRLFGSTTSRSRFAFEAAEMPVEVRGASTRIDILLRHASFPRYLVGECKRANPALSNWCFVKAPFTTRDEDRSIRAEILKRRAVNAFTVESSRGGDSVESYDIGIEVRSDTKGEPTGGKGAIEEAVSQVLRGMNGLVNFFMRDLKLVEGIDEIALVPVVFTTANLWVGEVDLQQTDLLSGNFPREKAGLRSCRWLVYRYHTSPGIKHERQYWPRTADVSAAIEREFARSVIIVNAAGIEEALSWATHADLGSVSSA
jgi:hypothetical protein